MLINLPKGFFMRKIIFSLSIASICLFSFTDAVLEGERFQQSEEAVSSATYGHIDAKGLKALIDSQLPFFLLDARGFNWHDRTLIPGAMLAFYEDSEEQLSEIAPDKDALIVVYCFSFNCPLSRRLAQKLVDLGYANVIEYPAGLREWRDIAHYPIEVISSSESD